jgi:rRNA maturation endonuclease Nob1
VRHTTTAHHSGNVGTKGPRKCGLLILMIDEYAMDDGEEKYRISAQEKLKRIYWWMTHCDKCERQVGWGVDVCMYCGRELMEHGKH